MSRIEKSVEIDTTIEKCYKIWTNLEGIPSFIPNVESIRRKGDPDVWQWRIKGAEGEILSCDVHIDGMKHRNNVISWHTIRDADVVHSGALTFKSIGNNRTLLNLVVDYTPPIAADKEKWSEKDSGFPASMAMETLRNFKNLVESQVVAGQISKNQYDI